MDRVISDHAPSITILNPKTVQICQFLFLIFSLHGGIEHFEVDRV